MNVRELKAALQTRGQLYLAKGFLEKGEFVALLRQVCVGEGGEEGIKGGEKAESGAATVSVRFEAGPGPPLLSPAVDEDRSLCVRFPVPHVLPSRRYDLSRDEPWTVDLPHLHPDVTGFTAPGGGMDH